MSYKGMCANGHPQSEWPRSWGCWRCRYNEKRRAERQKARWLKEYAAILPLKLFVYGTLKRGFGNNPVLGASTFVREAQLPQATMWTIGFPVIKLQGDGAVHGEVFEVADADTLRNLDRLEGHPHSYRRQDVTLADGETVQTYIWQRDTSGMRPVADGVFR